MSDRNLRLLAYTLFVFIVVTTIWVTSTLSRESTTSNHKVLCLQAAKLSHTPTVAEMQHADCDPGLLPTSGNKSVQQGQVIPALITTHPRKG